MPDPPPWWIFLPFSGLIVGGGFLLHDGYTDRQRGEEMAAWKVTDGKVIETGVEAVSGDDDTTFECGTIGQPCSDPSVCDSGQDCYMGGNGNICAPIRDGCGGFAGATCDDPSYPICLYLADTDYGVCVNADEKDCICNTSPGAIEPGYC